MSLLAVGSASDLSKSVVQLNIRRYFKNAHIGHHLKNELHFNSL
jgi:hypothetical protein